MSELAAATVVVLLSIAAMVAALTAVENRLFAAIRSAKLLWREILGGHTQKKALSKL
jgi:hypothetical protein